MLLTVRRAGRFIAAAVLLTSAGAAFAQHPSILVAPPPAWVVPASLDRLAPQAAAAPGEASRWLLRDQQINGQSAQVFHHDEAQALTADGARDLSRFNIAFDPNCQTLTFHWLRLWRGATAINRLDTGRIGVSPGAPGPDDFICGNAQQAGIALEDVQAGDLVDCAYTVTGSNPALAGRWFGRVPAQEEQTALQLHTRLWWPAARPIYTKNYLTDARPVVTRTGDFVEFLWDFKNVPGVRLESPTPPAYDPYPAVQLSEFHLWPEVNHWAASLFTNATPLPADLKRQIEDWRRRHDLAGAAAAALQFVQDEIRTTLDSGPDCYRPVEPAAVFARRFGDSKDKALLCCALLRTLGVEAWPALVNTMARQGIANWQPSPTAFNHAIVQATVDGRVYWLEPTAAFERGPLALRSCPDYGYALVLRPGAAGLTPIINNGPEPLTTVSASLQMGRANQPVTFKFVTLASGADAGALRARHAASSLEEMARDDLKTLSKYYPDLQTTAPAVYHDDEQANQVELDEFYRADNSWVAPANPLDLCQFPLVSLNVNNAMTPPASTARSMPMGNPYPVHQIFKAEAQILAASNIANQDQAVQNPAFYFHRTVNVTDHTLTLNYEYRSLSGVVPAEGFPVYLRQLGQASALLDFTVASYPERR